MFVEFQFKKQGNMGIYFIIFCTLINFVITQRQSPCPEIFSYEPESDESDKWYGIISLRTAEDLSGVWLRIALDRPAVLLGNWFGQASSDDNIEYVIRNKNYKLEAGPPVSIRFFVKYNVSAPEPKIVRIGLNGKTICTNQNNQNLQPTMPTLHISELRTTYSSDNRVSSQSSGNDNRQNRPSSNNNSERGQNDDDDGNSRERSTRKPSSNNGRPSSRPSGVSNFASDSDSDSEFFQGDFVSNVRPSQTRPVSASDHVSVSSSTCGVVATKPTPLISHGQDTLPGQWPWHAALYISKGIQLKYICGATLITEQHIVTAAHCVTKPYTNKAVSPRNMLVYLGKHDLITFGPDIQDRSLSEIFVHPDYNNTIFFNDIAVLKLSRPVKITNFVRPCCLWEGDTNLENTLHEAGTVVGWGFDEHGKLSNKLMQAKMPIVSTVDCIYSNRDFFSRFTFEKNFCAGFRNGTSVCNGDSGGGMVFPKKGTSGQNTVWQLRGLVSVGVALQGQGVCDTSQYIVFTDVAKYTHWIRQVIAF